MFTAQRGVQGNRVMWCLWHILLLGSCNGLSGHVQQQLNQQQSGVSWPQAGLQAHRSAAAAGAAALHGRVHTAGTSTRSSSSGSRLPMLRLGAPVPIPQGSHTAVQLDMQPNRPLSWRLRRRRNLVSSHAEAAGPRSQQVLPYPKDPAGIQRYLQEAESSSAAPYVIPVWFVVVVDPANPQATNISSQQVAEQLQLLNTAYATGLPSSSSSSSSSSSNIVTESGSGSNLRLGNAAAMVAAARGRAKLRTRRRPLAATTTSSSNGGGGSAGLWRFSLMGIRYTTSSIPMCVGSSTEQHIKQAWRQKLIEEGKTVEDRTLVVYVSDITAASCKGKVAGYSVVFGYGSTPFDLVFWKQRNMQHRDGVVIDARYLLHPGMQQAGAGMLHGAASGAQLVHEVSRFPAEQSKSVIDCTPAAVLWHPLQRK
uniref:Uncharacterized protein n=1 Tax=Tetradesmus obliquus TaxID=3088 RepID=A0A383W5Y4_TETOB|eukprot:jgi/Sobl393_1/4445/SZX72613.1